MVMKPTVRRVFHQKGNIIKPGFEVPECGFISRPGRDTYYNIATIIGSDKLLAAAITIQDNNLVMVKANPDDAVDDEIIIIAEEYISSNKKTKNVCFSEIREQGGALLAQAQDTCPRACKPYEATGVFLAPMTKNYINL